MLIRKIINETVLNNSQNDTECLCPVCPGNPCMSRRLYQAKLKKNYESEKVRKQESLKQEKLERLDVTFISQIAKNSDGDFELPDRFAAVDELVRRLDIFENIIEGQCS